jgi:hypothetical protein
MAALGNHFGSGPGTGRAAIAAKDPARMPVFSAMRALPPLNCPPRPFRSGGCAASGAGPASRPDREAGVALVMALIFSILLYILVAELVVASRMVRATGENDALLARMRTQMLYQLAQAEEQLLQDLAGAAAGGEGGLTGGGAMPGGLPGGGLPGGGSPGGGGAGEGAGGAGGEGEEEPDPAAQCDSSRDSWYEPTAFPETDLTTYVWVEDENRKFNLLALWSPDEKFAEFSRDRLVRLLDTLREDTEFDVSSSDAMRITQEILDWGSRPSIESMPKPRLKSEDERRRDLAVPLHLDELMLLPSVNEDLFFDKVLDGKVYLGLESVLTLWTAVRPDPGNPEKVARQRAQAIARGENPPEAAGGGEGAGGAAAGGAPGGNGDPPPPQPEGLGIRINVNTATRPVLRALFPPEKIPDRVLDAIIRYRNELDEEAMEALREESGSTISDFGNLQLGEDKKLKFFATTADLENVEEFAQLPDAEIKQAFQNALTTKSDVFSIHLVTLFKRSEENRVYVMRRARSIVMRIDDGEEGKIAPLVPFEERIGLRIKPIDMQEEQPQDFSAIYAQMDQFAQEERAWNPFLVDFYLPRHVRDSFYGR